MSTEIEVDHADTCGATYTPGPWTASVDHRLGYDRVVPTWYVRDRNGLGVSMQPAFSDESAAEANARLISASPELVEALKKHQAFFQMIVDHCFGTCSGESGSDLDYGEFLEIGEKSGLLLTEAYDPDRHGNEFDMEPGDTWYVPNHEGRAALSKALGTPVSGPGGER